MTLATARYGASLAHPHDCPLCGIRREANTIALPGLSIDLIDSINPAGDTVYIAGSTNVNSDVYIGHVSSVSRKLGAPDRAVAIELLKTFRR